MATKKKDLPTFRGKPLVRSGNVLYYGNPAESCIAMLQVLTNKEWKDITLADRVSVQILSTDESLHTSRRILKRTEKNGLYPALNIASIWLERTLSGKIKERCCHSAAAFFYFPPDCEAEQKPVPLGRRLRRKPSQGFSQPYF